MLIKTTGWHTVWALALLAALLPAANAAQPFLSLDCPLLAGGPVIAQYYEDGTARCTQLTLDVNTPNGTVMQLSPASCQNGRHEFPRYEARHRGTYSILVESPGKATATCTGEGVAVNRRKVPEMHPALALLAAIAALAITRKHGL